MDGDFLYMDDIVGTWYGSKSIPFIASGIGEVTVEEDGTAFAHLDVKALGKNHHFEIDTLKWEKMDDGTYFGSYNEKRVALHVSGDTLKATLNPYNIGLTTTQRLNINIPFELKRI